MYRVLSNISGDLGPKVKDQIMFYLVNASVKLLEIATSKFAGAYVI